MAVGITITKRVFFIVAIVSVVSMLIMISAYYNTGAVVGGQPLGATQQITDTIGILFYMNQFIGDQIDAITEYHLLCLGSYMVQTNAGRTRARQFLRFKNGFNGGLLTFKQAEIGRSTSDFLTFASDQPMFEYETVFDSGFSAGDIEFSPTGWSDMEDMEGEVIRLMGAQFTVLEAKVNINANRIKIRFIGPGGLVEFEDNYNDMSYNSQVQVNGNNVYAEVMIIGAQEGADEFGIYTIRYRPKPYNVLDVAPRHGLKGAMREPEKLLNSRFNMFFLGLRSGSVSTAAGITPSGRPTGGPGLIHLDPRGDEQYKISFTTKEASYDFPLITIRGGSLAWGDDDKNFIFKESQNIGINDYFLVTSRANDINARSNILIFERIDVSNNIVYIKDWKGGQKQLKYDGTGKGSFVAGGHTYKVQVNPATKQIKVDDGDGDFSDTFEATLVDGTRLRFSGLGTVKYIAPQRLFDERTSDEIANMQITKSGNDVRLSVTYPNMISSDRGMREGLMDYGARFVLEENGNNPEELSIYMPGSGATGAVGGGFGFSAGVGQAQGSVLITCEENVLRAKQAQTKGSVI